MDTDAGFYEKGSKYSAFIKATIGVSIRILLHGVSCYVSNNFTYFIRFEISGFMYKVSALLSA
jgi:hypothetical protein